MFDDAVDRKQGFLYYKMSFWDFLPSLFLMIKTPPFIGLFIIIIIYLFYFILFFSIMIWNLLQASKRSKYNVWSCFRKPPRK